ncbi:hypothetical protein F3B51_03790 [Bacteroides ovatus]|jgi:hypothetical protein|uniref:DUF6291 domain-containing protein n=2 Tax=Bacteroides TaxID=816 RepID=A0A414DV91_BACOV|nr:hypothetical protein F3F61_22245 [Bacteroides ovatus]MBS6550606.1 hypothetical protein [Bacteroides sp.]KAA4567642.1 hypothetical protein F3B68_02875 [Bacteroides ovatus]KAA4569574.1 hypothetical protein F3C56_04735 [Bacteroides ovatus]KAA4573155.1 hypothetical protein F3B65_03515 [Bacteroides ovatus]
MPMESKRQRDTFIFYRSFKESMSDLSDADKLIMYEAITDYSLDMKEPELTGFPKALFSLIRPFLDANTQRWKNGCKGGAPKGNKNNRFSKSTTEVQPEVNQSTTEVQANKDKNVNKDKNKDINKESTIVSKKDELSLSSPSEEFIKFNQWLDKHCPFVLKVKTQMTEPEYQKLLAKYTKKEICDVLESLNNWKDFPKKRTNVYRSTLDELKKKFGER